MVLSSLLVTSAICAGCAYAAPAAAASPNRQPGSFTYFTLDTPLAGPCDMTTGPDGAIWADTFLSNKLVRIDTNTGSLEEYSIPYTLGPLPLDSFTSSLLGRLSLACVVQPGKDGKIYAAAGIRNEFVVLDPKTKNITVFPTGNPLGNLQPFNDAWAGETGMWFTQTTANLITHFAYDTHKITSYTVPTPLSSPIGLYITPADSPDAIWFCEFLGQKIGRLNATTGEIKEYPVPLELLGPAVMRADTDGGRYIWFTAIVGGAIGRVDVLTGEIKAFSAGLGSLAPIEDTNDGNGNVWFSTLTQNSLNYFTPSTGRFTFIPQSDTLLVAPISILPAADIAMHWHEPDNSMWFTELALNRIGRYQLSGKEGK